MKLYFYCVFKNFKEKNLGLKSIDNQKLFYIHSNDLYAAVSHTKFREFAYTGENLKIHEKIINTISRYTEIVPFRFNTIVGETIGKGVLHTNYNSLIETLDKIGGKVEYCIKAEGKSRKDFKKLFNIKPSDKKIPESRLLEIGVMKLVARIQSELIKEAADSIYNFVPNSDRFFDGKYLVIEEKTQQFKQRIKWLKSLFPEIKISIDGPTPPYDFNPVNIGSEKDSMYGAKYL